MRARSLASRSSSHNSPQSPAACRSSAAWMARRGISATALAVAMTAPRAKDAACVLMCGSVRARAGRFQGRRIGLRRAGPAGAAGQR